MYKKEQQISAHLTLQITLAWSQIRVYCIVLNFHGLLILWTLQIFNSSQKHYKKIFWHGSHSFHALTPSVNGQHPRAKLPNLQGTLYKYLLSRHYFTDSCELEQMMIRRCMLDKPGLYAMPIVLSHVWRACAANLLNYFNKPQVVWVFKEWWYLCTSYVSQSPGATEWLVITKWA